MKRDFQYKRKKKWSVFYLPKYYKWWDSSKFRVHTNSSI